MTDNQKIAYDWAKSQNYTSVAARYAKELAGLVDELISALREQENKPLTPDELREMDGEPVWVEDLLESSKSRYCLCYWDRGKYFSLMSKHLAAYLLDDYGYTWLAYRHKPEEARK